MASRTRKHAKAAARRAAPFVALALGAVMIVFAVAWNRVPVIVPPEEAEAEASAVEPDAPPPPPPGIIFPDDTGGGFIFPDEPAPPQPSENLAEEGVAEATIVISTENEIIRETTRGGVTLNDDGEVERTYTGRPPQVCPT